MTLQATELTQEQDICNKNVEINKNDNEEEKQKKKSIQIDKVIDLQFSKYDPELEDSSNEESFYQYEPFIQQHSQEQIALIKDKVKLVESSLHHQICIDNQYQLDPFKVKKSSYWKSTHKQGHYAFYKDFIRDEKRGILEYINKKKIENQNKVMGYILKTMGKNLLQGKSIINVTLPVFIFEKRSNLERTAAKLLYAPTYLEKAALSQDPVEQMKLTIAFAMTHLIMSVNMEKPFNPILGETMQCWIDGNPLYLEQISHHPPILCFQHYGKGYQLYGSEESYANMSTNSIQGGSLGVKHVQFKQTKNKISFHNSQMYIEGQMMGQRTFNQSGVLLAWDLKNKLFGQVTYNPDKKGFFSFKKQASSEDFYKGGVYRVTDEFIQDFDPSKVYNSKGEVIFKGLSFNKHVENQLSDIQGIWHQKITFDDINYWTKDKGPFPHALFYEKYPLPSDSSFRTDLLHFKIDDIDSSQNSKEILEKVQRNDRKLREKYRKSVK